MNRLWAPWRLEFVTRGEKGACIFCSKLKEGDDRRSHIFARGDYTFGMLNTFPYNPGHLLIAPYRHVSKIADVSSEEWGEMLLLLRDWTSVLEDLMKPHGYNIGFNLGASAGGGFEHIHMHVVPRWSGDTNFMPVLAETKVLPEHLDATYDRVIGAMKSVKWQHG